VHIVLFYSTVAVQQQIPDIQQKPYVAEEVAGVDVPSGFCLCFAGSLPSGPEVRL
jgi:hypothetical protein